MSDYHNPASAEVSKDKPNSIYPPWWMLLFVIILGLVFGIQRSGLSAVFAGLGTSMCYKASRDYSHSWKTRVVNCIWITIGIWLFSMLVYGMFQIMPF